jgi:uncharacterized protein YjbI with pentapeptide repeats
LPERLKLFMRIVKPQHLSVLHRCFERDRKAYFCVTVIALVPLQSEPALMSEQELWQTVPELLGDTPLDMSVPKSGAEFLVAGDACAPGGQAVQGLKVSARVGNETKLLHVFGQRQWAGSKATPPVPYTRVPLAWTHAFGGPNFPDNTAGTGHEPAETPQGKQQTLPYIEYPKDPSMKPGKPVKPACFGALGPMAPQRKVFDGTYDDAWLKNEYPGPPKDFDWRYHCIAPSDQWQAEAYSGTEEIELIHMHPDHPQILTRLPGIAPIVAFRRKAAGDNELSFLQPRLTTVWLFPNQLRAALIWHAMMQTCDEFADEIDTVLVAAEWQDRPKGQPHYLHALNSRMDPETGGLKILEDEELLPEGLATPNAALEKYRKLLGSSGVSVQRLQENLQKNEAELNTKLTQAFGAKAVGEMQQGQVQVRQQLGLPELPAKMPQTHEEIVQATKALQQQAAAMPAMEQKLAAYSAQTLQQLRQEFASRGVDTGVMDALSKPARLPPSHQLSSVKALQDLDGAMHAMEQQMERPPGDAAPKITQQMKDTAHAADRRRPEMMRGLAHLQDKPPAIEKDVALRWRESAARAKAAGQSFAGLSLQGGDFSGMSLTSADFSNAQLDGADFSGADLTGANFDKASLAHASFERAQLANASFIGSNLGKANMQGAAASGAQFKDATLANANFSATDLSGCAFSGASFMDTAFEGARLCQARIDNSVIMRCDFTAADMSGGNFTKSAFMQSQLPEVNFSRSTVNSADFVSCKLDGANFDEALADNVRFVSGSTMAGVSFRGASARRASFRGLNLAHGQFANAKLDSSDFGEADCSHANFEHASLKNTMLMKTNLQSARLRSANLMQCILQHARLFDADLSGANLFGADLSRIEVNDQTQLRDAFTAKARRIPLHKVAAP